MSLSKIKFRETPGANSSEVQTRRLSEAALYKPAREPNTCGFGDIAMNTKPSHEYTYLSHEHTYLSLLLVPRLSDQQKIKDGEHGTNWHVISQYKVILWQYPPYMGTFCRGVIFAFFAVKWDLQKLNP